MKPEAEPAAVRWLGRYLAEQTHSLVDYVTMAANHAQRPASDGRSLAASAGQ